MEEKKMSYEYDVTDDELEAVAYFLEDYRLAKKNKEKNNEKD
jgi:hypothetical protein